MTNDDKITAAKTVLRELCEPDKCGVICIRLPDNTQYSYARRVMSPQDARTIANSIMQLFADQARENNDPATAALFDAAAELIIPPGVTSSEVPMKVRH